MVYEPSAKRDDCTNNPRHVWTVRYRGLATAHIRDRRSPDRHPIRLVIACTFVRIPKLYRGPTRKHRQTGPNSMSWYESHAAFRRLLVPTTSLQCREPVSCR